MIGLYVNATPEDSLKQLFKSINQPGLEKINPIVIITFFIVIIVFFVIFSILGTKHNTVVYGESNGMKFMELIFWGLFIFLILINGLQFFFNFDYKTSLGNLFGNKPELNINVGGKNWIDKVNDKDKSNDLTHISSDNSTNIDENTNTNTDTDTDNGHGEVFSYR